MTVRRPRARILGAIAAGTAALLALTGCALVQELTGQEGRAGEESALEVVDPGLAPELRPFYEQQVEWGACPAEVTAPDKYQCAEVSAPMNWDDPGEHEPISLFLVRRPADGASRGAMFTNPGGPGASGADFVALSAEQFFSSDLRQNFDVIGWDPRGVGRSSAVECRDDAGMDDYFYGVPEGYAELDDEARVKLMVEEATSFAEDCAAGTGPLLGYVDTASTVRDLDMMRALVGDRTLTYFGLSYGTDIGAKYIDQYPERVGRIVLDGATDPTVPVFDVIIDQQQKFADATRNYIEDCLSGTECPFKGRNVEAVIEEMRKIMREVDESLPKNADGRVLTSGVIDTAIVAALYDQSSWQYLSMAYESWIGEADPQLFFLLSDSYYGRDMEGHYDSNMFEAFMAINCLDYPLVTDEATIRSFHERLEQAALFHEPSEAERRIGDVTCENWAVPSRVTEQAPVRGVGAAPVLVVATTHDPATPLKWAEAVAEQLESGVLVEYDGEGHIAYDEGDACVTRTIDDYFIKGAVPANPTRC